MTMTCLQCGETDVRGESCPICNGVEFIAGYETRDYKGDPSNAAPVSRQGILDTSIRGFDRSIFRGTEARD